MSSNAFVNASGNNILDITGTLRMRNSGATIPANAAVPVKFFDDNNINSVDIKAPPVLDVSNTVYKLPTNYPATAGLSLLSDVAGNMSWGDPIGSLACLDASNVDISGLIVNVWNTPSQVSQAIGTCVQYTAARDISNGTVCITEISNNKVMAANPQSFQTGQEYEKLIGVALEDATAGSLIKILEEGYCSVRGDAVGEISGNILLTSGNSGNVFGVQDNGGDGIRFQDSGGAGGNYSINESYDITFDAGPGETIKIIIDASSSWQFEHGSSSMFDRLGFQTSTNGIIFNNGPIIPGMEQSSTAGPPWATGYLSPSPSAGYIFPEEFDGSAPFVFSSTHLTGNPTANDDGVQMDLAGVNGGTPKVYDTGTRYIKFYFESDVLPNFDGWNFIVSSGAAIGVSYPINSLLYLSSNSSGPSAPYSTVTSSNPSTGTSTIPIGYTLSIIETNPAEPYIFARIHDR